ncbi:MAG: DUF167 domain-containing protein [Patescibacteria group bacterium]
MILTAHVKPGAKHNEIKWLDEDTVTVSVTSAPEKGKANKAVIDLLSEDMGIRKSAFTIIRGATTRIKHIQIEK